jgi:hypothetical protein
MRHLNAWLMIFLGVVVEHYETISWSFASAPQLMQVPHSQLDSGQRITGA